MIFCKGNVNEILDFEYDDDTKAHGGCGATLHNVFWYFGGIMGSGHSRRVRFQKIPLSIYLVYYRQIKLLAANWSVKLI